MGEARFWRYGLFFFSSRRRHTRLQGDWSSDVCSSDLAVIALTDAGELVMERQYRYPLGHDMIEIPAGKIDAGEDPLATARRELKEETGYAAAEWRHVATIHIAIGYSNERIEIYLAKKLRHEGAKLDEEEFLEVFTLPLATALAWVRDGKITDSKTVAGLFWAEKVLGGEWGARPE